MENAADTVHVVLPVTPDNASELPMDELVKIAGGGGTPVLGDAPSM